MTCKVVAARVDALTIAFRVVLHEDTIVALENAKQKAREHGRAAVRTGRMFGEMRYTRGGGGSIFNVRNLSYRVHVDLRAPGGEGEWVDGTTDPGWTLELVWSAQALADMGDVTRAVRASTRIAESVGRVAETRLRRIDLAADVAGWKVSPVDAACLVKRPHAKVSQHPWTRSDAEEIQAGATLHERREIEGITVCPGGAMLARFYDKRKEIADAKDDVRRAAEEARWRRGGWDGEAPITRVEFQIRGQAIKEFGARDPERVVDPATGHPYVDARTGEIHEWRLADVLDRIWRACLRWVRLVRRTSARASRCKEDPRWSLLRGVSFVKRWTNGIARRVRQRSGATIEQAIGCVVSVLASRGRLAHRPETAPAVPDPMLLAPLVRGRVRDLYEDAALSTAEHLLERWGPAKALEHLAIVGNAVRERFAFA